MKIPDLSRKRLSILDVLLVPLATLLLLVSKDKPLEVETVEE